MKIFHWKPEEGGDRWTVDDDYVSYVGYDRWSMAPEGMYDLSEYEHVFSASDNLNLENQSDFCMLVHKSEEHRYTWYNHGVENQWIIYTCGDKYPDGSCVENHYPPSNAAIYKDFYISKKYKEDLTIEMFKEMVL